MGLRVVAAVVVAGAVVGAASAATPKVTLSVAVTGKGRVASAPKGISCPGKCRAKFAKRARVTLRATPAAGARFSRWTGACKGTAPRCTIRMTAAKRAGAVFATLPPPPPAGFTPSTLAGTWQGTWNDTRFNTSGSLGLTVEVLDATSFRFSMQFGGRIFGCNPQPALGLTLTQGTGANQWNSAGFTIQATGPAGGTISVRYDFATQRLSGTGRPGCRPGVTWALDGTFTGNTFSGRMTTTLEDGSTAPAVISLTRA